MPTRNTALPSLWQVCLTRAKSPWPYGNYLTLQTLWLQNPAGTCAMLQIDLQIDPWIKAAECERAISVVADPECRSVLISLRSLWIALGNDTCALDSSRQTGQVPKIAQIHAEMMSAYKNAMH